jgi:hypothetical protein
MNGSDALVTVACSIGALITALVAVVGDAQRRKYTTAATALESRAKRVDLCAPSGSEKLSVCDGDWVVATGAVSLMPPPAAHPQSLVSFNKDECAVICEVTTSKQISGTSYQQTEQSRAFRDTSWGLTGSNGAASIVAVDAAGNRSSVEKGISVQRDAIREAHERMSLSVSSGLTSGGVMQDKPDESWLLTMLKLFVGVLDMGTVREHLVLPLGITASVAGTATVHGGSISLGLHPAYGLFLFRGSTVALVSSLHGRAQLMGVVAGVSSGLTVALLWRAARAHWPHLPSLRLLAADFAQRHLGLGPPPASTGRPGGSDNGMGAGRRSVQAQADEPAVAGEEACVACLEHRRIAALVPCGHVVLCMACAVRLVDTDRGGRLPPCPLCRAGVQSVMRVWVS